MYGWKESYKNAMLETDRSKLAERIETAQTAIHRRLQQINGETGATIPWKNGMRFKMP